jgi:hypothetical protein
MATFLDTPLDVPFKVDPACGRCLTARYGPSKWTPTAPTWIRSTVFAKPPRPRWVRGKTNLAAALEWAITTGHEPLLRLLDEAGPKTTGLTLLSQAGGAKASARSADSGCWIR